MTANSRGFLARHYAAPESALVLEKALSPPCER